MDAWGCQSLGESHETVPSEGAQPWGRLSFVFPASELGDEKFPLLLATQCVVLGYSSPGKLTQTLILTWKLLCLPFWCVYFGAHASQNHSICFEKSKSYGEATWRQFGWNLQTDFVKTAMWMSPLGFPEQLILKATTVTTWLQLNKRLQVRTDQLSLVNPENPNM